MSNKLFTILTAVLVVLCLGVSFWTFAGKAVTDLLNAPQQIRDTSNNFLLMLGDENYESAYRLILSERQPDFGGSVEGMKQFARAKKWDVLTSWNFTSSQVNNDRGVVGGSVRSDEDTTQTVQIVLQKEHGEWKIAQVIIQ